MSEKFLQCVVFVEERVFHLSLTKGKYFLHKREGGGVSGPEKIQVRMGYSKVEEEGANNVVVGGRHIKETKYITVKGTDLFSENAELIGDIEIPYYITAYTLIPAREGKEEKRTNQSVLDKTENMRVLGDNGHFLPAITCLAEVNEKLELLRFD